MRTRLIFAAGLLVGAASFAGAQDMPPPPPADSAPTMTTPPPPPSDPNTAVPPAPVSNDPNMVPAAPGVPGNAAAPVGSAANPVVQGGNMTAAPPPAPLDHYPMCSKTVTDHCMQPGEARHHRMAHKKRK